MLVFFNHFPRWKLPIAAGQFPIYLVTVSPTWKNHQPEEFGCLRIVPEFDSHYSSDIANEVLQWGLSNSIQILELVKWYPMISPLHPTMVGQIPYYHGLFFGSPPECVILCWSVNSRDYVAIQGWDANSPPIPESPKIPPILTSASFGSGVGGLMIGTTWSRYSGNLGSQVTIGFNTKLI